MEKNIDTINTRLFDFFTSLNISAREFERAVGMSNGMLGKIKSSNKSFSVDTLEKIFYTFPHLNPTWLVLGQGEMTGENVRKQVRNDVRKGAKAETKHTSFPVHDSTTQDHSNTHLLVITQDISGQATIPIIPQRASANYTRAFQSAEVAQEYFKDLSVFTFPIEMLKWGQYYALEVDGESMEPNFYNKDVIICKRAERAEWVTLRDNRAYVVVSQDGIQLKRIRFNWKRNFLRCKSDNSFDNPPFDIPVDQIIEIWEVRFKITSHLSIHSGDLQSRILNLEDRFEDIIDELSDLKGKS